MFVLNKGVECIVVFSILVLPLLNTVSCDPSPHIIESTTITPSPLEALPYSIIFFFKLKAVFRAFLKRSLPSSSRKLKKSINASQVLIRIPVIRLRGSLVPSKESDITSLAQCFKDFSLISDRELKYAFCFSTYLRLHPVSSVFGVRL